MKTLLECLDSDADASVVTGKQFYSGTTQIANEDKWAVE